MDAERLDFADATFDAEQTERVRADLAERVRERRRPDGLYLAATALLATARR